MLNPLNETVGDRTAGVSSDAEYFEYTSSANPIGAKIITRVPYRTFDASLYGQGETRLVPLDISSDLKIPFPATAPGLCAHFVRINAGDSLDFGAQATSLIYYVIQGAGVALQGDRALSFAKGDFFTFPGGGRSKDRGASDYLPLLRERCPPFGLSGRQCLKPAVRTYAVSCRARQGRIGPGSVDVFGGEA